MKQYYRILIGLLICIFVATGIATARKYNSDQIQHRLSKTDKEIQCVDRTKTKNFHISSDDIKMTELHDSMRQKTNSQRKVKQNSNSARKAESKLYTVKCVFDGDYEMPYMAIFNEDFCEETSYEVWDESDETDTYYFQVPAGIYDVYLDYYSYVEGMEGFARLVHEDITVESDMEVLFSASELTEKTQIKPILINGVEAILPTVTFIDEEPWQVIDYTGANTDFINYNYVFLKEGCDILATGYSMADCKIEGWNDGCEYFLSNKISDKYHLVYQFFIEDSEGEVLISTSDISGFETQCVNNYIKDCVKFDCPSFVHTPLYDEFTPDKLNTAVTGLMWLDNVQVGGGGVYMQSTHPKVYWAQQDIHSLDVKSPVSVESVQGEKTVHFVEEWDDEVFEYDETFRTGICAKPALYDGGDWEYINQNHSECGNFSYQCPEDGPIVEYPGVPAYCYFSDQQTEPLGNSAPIMVMMTQINKWGDDEIFLIDPQAYIGRYGEVRNCDQWTLESVVKLDGTTVFDSNTNGYMEDWCIENSLDGHAKGLMEATFTNPNVLVDGEIEGFNISKITVDERNEDLCTPTPQMLMFKSKEGVITDRFNKPEEGVIEFSAGDFNWVTGDNYYTCEEADVTVEYAPYGTDSFLPIEVEEIPENYYMPGFGYFYRGSLAAVDQKSENGWFDVRFTLEDKAGNKMVQTISPAFRIDTNVGVAQKAVNGVMISADGGLIRVLNADAASISLYALDGSLVATAESSVLSTNGYHGVALVKVTDRNGVSSAHKTIIR